MYHSRLHFENEFLHLALDSMTGEVLELCHRKTGENLIKNSLFSLPQPFTLHLRGENEVLELSPPHSRDALEHPELRCEISSEKTEQGLCVRVHYPRLWDGKEVYPISFTYTATLCGDEIRWHCTLHNGTDGTVTQVRFPILNGIWLGRDWKENVLYYPRYAGERYEDPVAVLSEVPTTIDWRWQEYRYKYLLSGVAQGQAVNGRGLRGKADRYPGGASMSWMELDGKDLGFYFACHDPKGKPCGLEAGTYGAQNPGLCFALSYEPRVFVGKDWASPDAVTAVHTGDWHAGAARYRAFRAPLLPEKKATPDWLSQSHGLFAHYDFKYQNGGVVHTYRDLPRLAKEAKESGLCHLLLAGWHRDGFDCGFPMYEPDPELGSEQELIDGIAAARALGVHVTLYMNVRLHNRAYHPETVDQKAVMAEDGSISCETYGNPHLHFSAMCPQSELWQNEICEAVRRGTEVYGADGIYFDQLCCSPVLCFHPAHRHAHDAWNYTPILQRVAHRHLEAKGTPLCLMGEWACDLYGTQTDFLLNQTFYNLAIGGFPQLYRYTFPDHGIVDMIYPTQNLAMRPVHVAQSAKDIMGTLFTNGSYFWIYDLEEDNTFSRDPEGTALLSMVLRLCALRRQLLPNGQFCDRDGIYTDAQGVFLSRFSDGTNDLLCLFATDDSADMVRIALDGVCAKRAIFCDGNGAQLPYTVENGVLTVPHQTGIILLKP